MEIKIYDRNGKLKDTLELNCQNIEKVHGMMIKCYTKDDKEYVGYCDSYRFEDDVYNYDGKVHDHINLSVWKNLDENTHSLIGEGDEKYAMIHTKIDIDKIICMKAILYSGPRWGGQLTNKWFIEEND